MPPGYRSPNGPQASSSSGKTKYQAIVEEANRLHQIAPPYSNARPPSDSIGYDCSSACAQLMRTAGYDVPFFSTADAPDYMKTGQDPTGRLTFWNNDHNRTAGNSVHIFATIDGRDWGTGYGAGGGPGWNSHSKEGFSPYWIEGLDDPAGTPLTPEGGEGTAGGGASANAESLAKSAAFATFFNLASVMDVVESQALKGERSLMNDEPLMPFVQQLTEASMRNFQSMPNGNFFAFYPDYFGGLNHRTPYWKVTDTEIIDGNINLSDDSLATHVYVVGSWFQGGNEASPIGLFTDKINAQGVITIFNAFMIDFLNGTTDLMAKPNTKSNNLSESPLAKKANAIAFLKKYGARPHYEEMPFIKNKFYEIFLAFQRFCLLWSQQFSTEFQLTFMPELFPGGLIEFEGHDIQCYIDEVTHTCSYASGFTTTISISAPATTSKPSDTNKNKNIGMIRADIFGPNASS
jgi:hypothetical protein